MYLVKKINWLDANNTLRKALSDSRRVITYTEFNASVELALLCIQQQQQINFVETENDFEQ